MHFHGRLVQIYLLLPNDLRPWDEESRSRHRTIVCFVSPKQCLMEFKALVVGLRPRYASIAFYENDQFFICVLNELGEIKL